MPDLNKASPSSSKQTTGQEIESHVSTYLQKQGFELLYRNFRCRLGEIDLIGLYQNQLLFIEVRFRRNTAYGGAAASVDFRKQQKLIKAAQFFLLKHPKMANCACRFDVVAVTLRNQADHELEIDWIQNAFC
ncbi:MAG TPA: YraN family protein [Gammaproteobacteria bacterium]|nr:YraN family protein [Gammaproteobacteria bacterium]